MEVTSMRCGQHNETKIRRVDMLNQDGRLSTSYSNDTLSMSFRRIYASLAYPQMSVRSY